VKYKYLSFYLFIFLAFPLGVQAITELEPAGTVYPVVEPDLRIEMKQKAAENWDRQKKEYQEKIHTYQPASLQLLPKAEQDRCFTVDMTYTLDRNLTDKDGTVLYPKGYRFNPLDYMSFTIGLVVIDGNDPAQVKWYKDSPYSSNHKMKLLLSGGSAQAMISELNRAVFYLDKEIATRFQLAAVPSVVVQQDKQIQVTEFLIQEGNR
jgi:conjugal transfer pilus assembly protein TraW